MKSKLKTWIFEKVWIDEGLFLLRLGFGLGIAYHGYGKIFGGYMGKFAMGVAALGIPFPEFFAWAAALSEFVGGLLLVLGLLTRPAAFFIMSTMLVAVFGQHLLDPFHPPGVPREHVVRRNRTVVCEHGELSHGDRQQGVRESLG